MGRLSVICDMDGVIYRGKELIPGATEFVAHMRAEGIPFLFLTNNSAPTPEDLAVRLGHLGIRGLGSRHFYTSAMNTADFLSETDPNCTVYVIGGKGHVFTLVGSKTEVIALLAKAGVTLK